MPLLGKKIAHYIFFLKKNYIDGHLLKKKKDEHKNPKQTRIKIYIKKNWRSNRGKKKLVLLVEEKIEEPKKCTFGRL